MRASLRRLERPLYAASLLATVRADPGNTAAYYANRYFGGSKSLMTINHLLWSELKRFGKVDVQRARPDDAPQWVPASDSPRWRHRVVHHNPEDEDLSLLKTTPATSSTSWKEEEAPPTSSQPAETSAGEADEALMLAEAADAAVLEAVQHAPGKDMQSYMIVIPDELRPLAPAAFRRLRLAGLLQREPTSSGAYVWL